MYETQVQEQVTYPFVNVPYALLAIGNVTPDLFLIARTFLSPKLKIQEMFGLNLNSPLL